MKHGRTARPRAAAGSILALAALLGSVLPDRAAAQTGPQADCRDLRTVSLQVVGSVCVAVREGTLEVVLGAAEGASLLESHVAAAPTLEGFPLSESGTPRLGAFPHSTIHVPPAESARYEVPLSEADREAGVLLVSVHASVLPEGGGEDGAWAEGVRFREPGNPATYFEVRLPTGARP